MDYSVYPPEDILEAQVALPVSKSVMSRRMIIKSMCGDSVSVPEYSCRDIELLGAALSLKEGNEIYLGQSATALRFLTAYFASRPGVTVMLTGDKSLYRRPISLLVDTLTSLGAQIKYLGEEGFAPVEIVGTHLNGATLDLEPGISSQWISALMMIAPGLPGGLHINFLEEPKSYPYLELTASVMREAGVDVELSRGVVTVAQGEYSIPSSWSDMDEGDWSAASFWYEITALSAGWATLHGAKRDTMQGDRYVADLFSRLGVESTFEDGVLELSASPEMYSRMDFDATDYPDLVPPVAVTCAALGVPFKITGASALVYKESDRLSVLASELLKIGCVADRPADGVIEWLGRRLPVFEMPVIDPHGDHRIAMAFAPLAVFVPGIVIKDAEVVNKSWPGYWQSLQDNGFTVNVTEDAC